MLVFPGAFNMVTGPAHWELLARSRAMDAQVPSVVRLKTFACDDGDGFSVMLFVLRKLRVGQAGWGACRGCAHAHALVLDSVLQGHVFQKRVGCISPEFHAAMSTHEVCSAGGE